MFLGLQGSVDKLSQSIDILTEEVIISASIVLGVPLKRA